VKLDQVERGHDWSGKFKMIAIGAASLTRPPDVLRLLLYRPELFGKPFSKYVDTLLRGDSAWSVGERELFAAFVSQLNHCAFCTGAHRAVAARALGEDVVAAAMNDWRTAPLRSEARGAMGFLEKLITEPTALTHGDAETAFNQAVTAEALEEVAHIATIFCIINPLADSLGFAVPSAAAFARMAGPLLKHGYGA